MRQQQNKSKDIQFDQKKKMSGILILYETPIYLQNYYKESFIIMNKRRCE